MLDRSCIEALRCLRETERNTKGLYSWIGFKKFGIYYDQPGEVEESKLRSSVGIYKKNMTKIAEQIPEDLEKYCESKGYIKNELPMADSLYSNWDYINVFSMMLGIAKYLHRSCVSFFNLSTIILSDIKFKR